MEDATPAWVAPTPEARAQQAKILRLLSLLTILGDLFVVPLLLIFLVFDGPAGMQALQWIIVGGVMAAGLVAYVVLLDMARRLESWT